MSRPRRPEADRRQHFLMVAFIYLRAAYCHKTLTQVAPGTPLYRAQPSRESLRPQNDFMLIGPQCPFGSQARRRVGAALSASPPQADIPRRTEVRPLSATIRH